MEDCLVAGRRIKALDGYTDGCLLHARRRSSRVHCGSPVLRAYRKVQSVGLSYMLTPKAGASTLRVMESVCVKALLYCSPCAHCRGLEGMVKAHAGFN